ncbi:serine hydrolase [candidate division KSB1 bacterium]|nr:serine hydrolase [candidate division KSB1 bacterium]
MREVSLKPKSHNRSSNRTFGLFLNFKPLVIFFLLILLLLTSTASLLSKTTFDSTLAAQLQTTLDNWRSSTSCTGVSAAVIIPAQGIWLGASGMSNPAISDKMRTEHLFWISGITNIYIATVTLQLAEEGKLTLDDPLLQWLPDYQHIDNKITIRQLLNHTSGIYSIQDDPTFYNSILSNPDRTYTPEDILKNFVKAPKFEPGSSWYYSSTNPLLLGMIIEKATQSHLYTEMKNRIGVPLNLNNTYFQWSSEIQTNVANPWQDINGDAINENLLQYYKSGAWSALWAQDNIISSAEDVAIFLKGLFEGKLLNQESLVQMLTVVSDKYYGLGIANRNLFNREIWWMDGAIPGFRTEVFYSPEDSICIAAFKNDRGQAIIDVIATELFRQALKLKLPFISFNLGSMSLDTIPDNVQSFDTTLYVHNIGGATDSVFTCIDCGTADSNAFCVSPKAFEIAPGDSQAITYQITPSYLEPKLYRTKIIVQSQLSPIQPSTFISILFRITKSPSSIEKISEVPTSFVLKQNYPNPFNSTTVIEYSLPSQTHIKLTVYDILGQEIITLVNQQQKPGTYKCELNTRDYPSGVYVYKLETEDFMQVRKMLLLR